MFAKLSLMSFIYEILETIFKKHGLEKVYIYHISTDTDSTSLKFLFICDLNSDTPESK